jgi:hypothetical protein
MGVEEPSLFADRTAPRRRKNKKCPSPHTPLSERISARGLI